ncbi:MAG: hypothetical protein LBE33_05280 [Zoogloeaceae bacterium]|jgi:hypothetical protein|nr:hypothetical protein [Zoogloeaceae bacterium]
MRPLVESLTWTSGFFVVAVMSSVLALFTGRLQPTALRWIACILVPAAISYCLYWSPVWLGANSSEYWSWSVVFVIPWSLAGILASTAVMIGVRQYLRAKHARNA